MRRCWPLLLVALIAASLAAVACSSNNNGKGTRGPAADKTADPSDYFSALRNELKTDRSKVDAAERDLHAAASDSANLDDAKKKLKSEIATFQDTSTKIRTALNGIAPPTGLSQEHGRLINPYSDTIRALDQATSEVDGVKTDADLATAGQHIDAQITELRDRVAAACTTLQQIADDDGVDVDLQCAAQG